MKINTKILIGLMIVIGLGSLIQGVVRVVTEGALEREILQSQVANSARSMANTLPMPIWNFDTLQVEAVIKIELEDRNLLAVELRDNLGDVTVFYGWYDDSLDDFTNNPAKREELVQKALFAQSSDLEFQGNSLGKLTVFATDRVLVEKMNQKLLGVIVFALLFAVALFFVISIMLRQIVVEPVSELTQVVSSFSEDNLTVRSSYSSNDEIGILSVKYNKMLDTIQEYTESLEQKVQERTKELADANEVLRRQKAEMDRNLRMAQKIQLNLIPSELTYPKREELNFSSLYSAMDAIGGDIFDIIRTGRNSFGLLMADVSGHGIPAALVTTMVKVSFNTHAQTFGVKPSDVCYRVNQDISKLLGNDYSHYLTAFFGIINLEQNKFEWANCGHHPAILVRDGMVIRLGNPGPFIGFIESPQFQDESIELEKGDRIILFTDGIVEARNEKGEMFDIQRLLDICVGGRDESPSLFVKHLLDDLKKFCGNEVQDDDRAVLVVDYISERMNRGKPTLMSTFVVVNCTRAKKGTQGLPSGGCDPRQVENYTEALEIVKELYKEYPDDVKVITNYSLVLYRLGRYQDALDILKDAYDRKMQDEIIVNYIKKIKEKIASS